MKEFHSKVYQDGFIGMCNALMSVECAMVFGNVSDREVYLYQSKSLQHSQKHINDLFDFPSNIHFVHKQEIDPVGKITIPSFFENVLYTNTSPDASYVSGRSVFNINSIDSVPSVRTNSDNNLAFYSNVFYLDDAVSNRIYNYIKDSIKPKSKYEDIANEIIWGVWLKYGDYASIHVRRGDKLYAGQPDIDCRYIAERLSHSIVDGDNLLIHTDEQDKSFFNPLASKYNVIFVEDEIQKYHLDGAESGLVSILVASHSSDFIGTLGSTFSSYIQRYRVYNGLKEEFKYLYPMFDAPLDIIGRMVKHQNFNSRKAAWAQMDMGIMLRIAFWAREWPEFIPFPLRAELEKKWSITSPKISQPKENNMYIENVISEKEQTDIVIMMNKKSLQWEGHDPHFKNSWGMGAELDDPILGPILNRLTPEIERIFGKELEPSGLYTRIYRNGGFLKAHIDRPDLEYTASLCVVAPDVDWHLWVDGDESTNNNPIAINIGARDAAVMNGRVRNHWREELVCDDDDMGMYIFFHWKAKSEPANVLQDSWYHIEDNFVSESTLTEINTLLQGVDFVDAMVKESVDGKDVIRVNPAVRSNKTAASHTFPARLNEIINQLDERVCRMVGVNIDRKEGMVILRYGKGQYFTPHLDCNFSPPNDREYTYIIYLNTVETGGQTNFPNANVKVEAVAGRLLVWKNMTDGVCDHNTMHESIPVLKGRKEVMVNWIFQRTKGQ